MRIKSAIVAILNKVLAKYGAKIVKMAPMEKVLFELTRRGVNIESLNALEVFGRIGTWHTMYYAGKVKTLDVWEINPKCEEFLIKLTNG